MNAGRILIIRGGAIGDFILTLPAIAALRRQFPDAHIEVLGYPHIAQLALVGGLADAVRPIEARGLAAFFARHGELDFDIAKYFAGFDLILSYLFDPDNIFRGNVSICSQAQFIQGPHRPSNVELLHATELYLKPLERLAIFDADPVPHLSLNSQLPALNSLALHPGSGSDRKNWPEARWADMLGRLVERTPFHLLVVGGEAEGGRLERLTAAMPTERFTLARSLPLVDLAGRLQPCMGFVGHDSGITHLAAALGLPCVVLWADTMQEIWRPQGENIIILRESTGLRTLAVDRVFEAVAGLLR